MEKSGLYGRRLLKKELGNFLTDEELVDLEPMLIKKAGINKETNGTIKCERCGSSLNKWENSILNESSSQLYCPNCMVMGRVVEQDLLYHLAQQREVSSFNYEWKGKLSQAQERVSKKLVELVRKKQNVLVHAVTGAGKTEMIFEVVRDQLEKGKIVCITSPRVDVCLELYPRLKEVFKLPISLLYGKQEEVYQHCSLVVCTTHQLLRFYQAFDLLIIDEVDAFPFRGNPMLEYGVRNALALEGCKIYLTATPTRKLEKEITAHHLEKVSLPRRFHGHPLPVPRAIWSWNWYEEIIFQKKLPKKIYAILNEKRKKQRRVLIFVPTKKIVSELEKSLVKAFPMARIGSASSQDEERYEKVKQMRQELFDFFIVTTILERGVTFSDIDVLVIGSNHEIFNEASLVQIAGRVGRKAEFPSGDVFFVHDGWSEAMKLSIRQIKQMNRSEIEGV